MKTTDDDAFVKAVDANLFEIVHGIQFGRPLLNQGKPDSDHMTIQFQTSKPGDGLIELHESPVYVMDIETAAKLIRGVSTSMCDLLADCTDSHGWHATKDTAGA